MSAEFFIANIKANIVERVNNPLDAYWIARRMFCETSLKEALEYLARYFKSLDLRSEEITLRHDAFTEVMREEFPHADPEVFQAGA